MIYPTPTRLVHEVWPMIERHVAEACRYHPFLEAEDLLTVLLYGNARLFVVTREGAFLGFAIMEVVEYPRRKVANVIAAGGERGFLSAAVVELLPVLQAWGIEQGADTFALIGRPGWVRALRHLHGQATAHVTWWTDLNVKGRRKQQHTATDLGIRAVGPEPTVSN